MRCKRCVRAQWGRASDEVRKVPVTKLMNVFGILLVVIALGILIKLVRAGAALVS